MKVFIFIILIGLLLSCNKFSKRNDANEPVQNLSNSISIDVLINVYIGRRSVNSNILYCAILSGPISKIREKEFSLNGGLIGERSIKINNIKIDKTGKNIKGSIS